MAAARRGLAMKTERSPQQAMLRLTGKGVSPGLAHGKAFVHIDLLLETQLEAMLEVARRMPVGVLIPMVTTEDDVAQVAQPQDPAQGRSPLRGPALP